MKTLTLGFALLYVTTLIYAAPRSNQEPRQFEASITFLGAGPGPPFYFQAFPTDDTIHKISKHPVSLIPPDMLAIPRKPKYYSVIALLVPCSYGLNWVLNIHTDNTLSVSHISSPGGAACTFFGIDGSDTFIFGEETVDVGPPQAQVSGICDSD